MFKLIKMLRFIYLVFLFFWFSAQTCFAELKEQWVPVALHVATTISDGSLTLDEIVQMAKSKGFKALVVTDRDFMKWEYGLATIEQGSVFKYGVDKYLKDIELESKKNPGIVIIPGLESAPYYHWSGLPLFGSFKISDWHKHLLVIGLFEPNDFKNLPVLANRSKLKCHFRFSSILLFWPFGLLVVGVLLFLRREISYTDDAGKELGGFSRKSRIAGIAVILLSIIFIVNNSPFCSYEYNQYADVSEGKPYQMLIDYVRQKGGMTFWAHPEVKNFSKYKGIAVETVEHIRDMWKTQNYTGFSIFYEGYEKVGRIGGDWDYLLSAYCDGKRESPVWATAGLAFDYGSKENLAALMDDLQVYVLVPQLSSDVVLDAMKNGKMYVSEGIAKNKLFIDEFIILDKESNKNVTMGATLKMKGNPIIEIKGHWQNVPQATDAFEARLVKDGKVIKMFQSEPGSVFDIHYEDYGEIDSKSFYRFEVINGAQKIITNPIFIESYKKL